MKASIISILKIAMVGLLLLAVTNATAGEPAKGKKAGDSQEQTLININTASMEQLVSLPRIGPAMAQRIVDFRERHGAFKRIEELLNIKGIGPKVFEKLKDRVCL